MARRKGPMRVHAKYSIAIAVSDSLTPEQKEDMEFAIEDLDITGHIEEQLSMEFDETLFDVSVIQEEVNNG